MEKNTVAPALSDQSNAPHVQDTQDTQASMKKPHQAKPKKPFSIKPLIYIFFFLLLVMLFLTAVMWREMQLSQQVIQQLNKNLVIIAQQQILANKNVQQKINALETRFSQYQIAIDQKNANLLAMISQSHTQVKTLSETLADTAYFIRLANITLAVQQDIPATIELLKHAKNSLEDRKDSQDQAKIKNVYTAVSNDISILEQLPVVDFHALILKLTDLREKIPTLSVLVSPKTDTSVIQNTPREAHKKWWHHAWNNIKASLQQLVIVRHRESAIPALMSPDAQLYLQENLQLLLMQAQWALITHNHPLYQETLQQARLWIEKYYVQNTVNTQNCLKDIQWLRAQYALPALPNLTAVLSLLPKGI